jgi:hypothetical protein
MYCRPCILVVVSELEINSPVFFYFSVVVFRYNYISYIFYPSLRNVGGGTGAFALQRLLLRLVRYLRGA